MTKQLAKNSLLKQNLMSLEGEMKGLNDSLDLNPEDLFPSEELLPGLNDIEIFDYKKEIENIQTDCEETLDCLSSLYLKEEELEKKNISNIVKNDALALADLKFSLFCSKRGLINLMKQLDMGVNDPEMYMAVGTFQKEIRDSIKMLYDIQKRMKDFYKDIREEIATINSGDTEEEQEEKEIKDEGSLYIIDYDRLNTDIDDYKKGKK